MAEKQKAAFAKMDTNQDGSLSPEEFAAAPAKGGKGGKSKKNAKSGAVEE